MQCTHFGTQKMPKHPLRAGTGEAVNVMAGQAVEDEEPVGSVLDCGGVRRGGGGGAAVWSGGVERRQNPKHQRRRQRGAHAAASCRRLGRRSSPSRARGLWHERGRRRWRRGRRRPLAAPCSTSRKSASAEERLGRARRGGRFRAGALRERPRRDRERLSAIVEDEDVVAGERGPF
jgi:hypothetical protein